MAITRLPPFTFVFMDLPIFTTGEPFDRKPGLAFLSFFFSVAAFILDPNKEIQNG